MIPFSVIRFYGNCLSFSVIRNYGNYLSAEFRRVLRVYDQIIASFSLPSFLPPQGVLPDRFKQGYATRSASDEIFFSVIRNYGKYFLNPPRSGTSKTHTWRPSGFLDRFNLRRTRISNDSSRGFSKNRNLVRNTYVLPAFPTAFRERRTLNSHVCFLQGSCSDLIRL